MLHMYWHGTGMARRSACSGALGEVLVVVLVSWHEDRAALDLALGLVVLLRAPPGISDGKADLVMLDAASALEGAAHTCNLHYT